MTSVVAVRLKHVTEGMPSYGVNVSSEEYREDGFRLLRTTDINDHGEINDNAEPVFVDRDTGLLAPLRTNDILLSRSGTVGRALRVREEMQPVTHAGYLIRFRPDQDRVDPRFLEWAIRGQAFQDQVTLHGIQSTIVNVNAQRYASMVVTHHPLQVQSLIADFLDRETHRIDALVDAKRRMIDLLGEKRESSITRRIWSGSRPTTRLSFHADLLAGYAFPSNEFSTSPDDLALLRGANIGVGKTRWGDTVYWSEAKADGLERYRLNSRDIVLGLDRPWITGGIRVAMIGDEDLPALLLQRVLRIRTKQNMSQRFVFYLLQSRPFLAHFEPEMTGISVPHISPDQVGDFSFPAYEVGEQAAIVEELDRLTSIIDSATSTLSRQLDLLAEYRQALITQAVTGQLDDTTLKGNKPVEEAVGVIPE